MMEKVRKKIKMKLFRDKMRILITILRKKKQKRNKQRFLKKCLTQSLAKMRMMTLSRKKMKIKSMIYLLKKKLICLMKRLQIKFCKMNKLRLKLNSLKKKMTVMMDMNRQLKHHKMNKILHLKNKIKQILNLSRKMNWKEKRLFNKIKIDPNSIHQFKKIKLKKTRMMMTRTKTSYEDYNILLSPQLYATII